MIIEKTFLGITLCIYKFVYCILIHVEKSIWKKKWLAMDGKKMFSNFKIYLKIQSATYMNLLYTV